MVEEGAVTVVEEVTVVVEEAVDTDPVEEAAASVAADHPEASAAKANPMEVDMALQERLPLHTAPLKETINQAVEASQGGRQTTTMMTINRHANRENHVVIHITPPQCVRLVLQWSHCRSERTA